MSDVPVTQSAGSITRFLGHIKTAGIPPKVNTAYLKSAGFTSSNDIALLKVFKALKFIDATGAPTDRWKQYRDASRSKFVLAEAVRDAYSGLFSMYNDAHRKDDEAISNWLRSNTDFAGLTIDRAVRTFKALSTEADFSETGTANPPQSASVPTPTAAQPIAHAVTTLSNSPSVNINVELHLPSSTDPKVYELFFSAMKKHLLDESK